MTKYLKITDISLCHRYNIDIPKKPISKAPIRYNIIDVGNVSRYFRYIEFYRPTSMLEYYKMCDEIKCSLLQCWHTSV